MPGLSAGFRPGPVCWRDTRPGWLSGSGVTDATGRLGTLVVDALLRTTPAAEIAGLVRPAESGARFKAERLEAQGVQVRICDYADPASFRTPLERIKRLLFIFSSKLDGRVA